MPALPANPDDLLAGLDPEQRMVAQAVSGPVVVMAGAGTGKTRAITHRIAYGVATDRHDAQSTLAVTFTNRAAGEMTRRLSGLGVQGVRVRTFHSAALRQLRWAWPQAIGGQMHEVFESKSSLVASALAAQRIATDQAIVRDVCTEIEWAKMMGVDHVDYPELATVHGRKTPAGLELEQVGAAYEQYEASKRVANRIDFEDVLLLTVAVLEEREDLRRQVQASFKYFTVDEFQDVSAIQRRLLTTWMGERDDVCVVGDIAQTIYSFAGADPSHLLDFGRGFNDPTVISLNRCYRCTPQIVDIAEQVLQSSAPGSALLATRASHRKPLKSQQKPGPRPTFIEYPDEHAEAAAVVRRIKEMIAAGRSPSEIAILVRINALTEQFETQLSQAGIPYSIRGGRRFFERPEVKKAISLLRGAARAATTVGDGPTDLKHTVRAILASVGWAQKPPTDTGAVRESWESVAALVALCDEVVATNPDAELGDVLAAITSREESADAPAVDGVTIASLHAAKGMEWDAVFLVGLVDGMMPMSHANTPAQIEEERRLLYVGITRARIELCLSWALTRAGGGRHRKPSRFLTEIRRGDQRVVTIPKASKSSAAGGRKPASCRRCGKALVTAQERSVRRCRTCPGDVDEALLRALREWRKQQVIELSDQRQKQIPAYVVATDATLFALAEERPTDMAELAEIPGLGPAKLAAHGESILRIVAGSKSAH